MASVEATVAMEAAVAASEMAPAVEAAVMTATAVVLAAARAKGLMETTPAAWLAHGMEWRPCRR